MPAHLTMIAPIVPVTIILYIAVFVLRQLWKKSTDETGLRSGAIILQLFLLSVAFLAAFTCISAAALGAGWHALAEYDFLPLKQSIQWGTYISVLLLVPIVIGYLVRSSTTAIFLSMLCSVIFAFGIYAWIALPTVNAIREADVAGLFDDSLLLSVWYIPLRLWIWSIVTLIYGFCFVRRRFSTARLLISTALAGFVIGMICMPVSVTIQLWSAPFTMAVTAWLIAALPFSRIVLANHFGIPFKDSSREPLPAKPLPARILATVCALFLIAGVGFSAFVNYHEKIQADTVTKGNVYKSKITTGINAYDVLKQRFLKHTSHVISSAGQPTNYAVLLQLIDPVSSATRTEIIANIDRTEWNAYLSRIEPFLHDLERASHADYLRTPANKALSYLNLREANRALSIRSQMAWHDGRTDDAITDLNTILNSARLMAEQPSLVEQMMGIALKNLAIHTAENLLSAADDRPDALNKLSAALDNAAPQMERGLDYTALKAGQAGILSGAIIPNIEVTVPAIGRAHQDAQKSWADYHRVRRATAEAITTQAS